MSSLFNEAEADAIVTANIAKYKRQLSLIKELDKMHLFKEEGQVYQVVSFESVHREDLVAAVREAADALKIAEGNLSEFDKFAPAEPKPEQPAPAQAQAAPSVPSPAPAQPTPSPAPAPQPQPAPAPQAPVGAPTPIPTTIQ